ncbi:MAG: hypothetical protein L3J34_02810 [Flavobacteriaceae bacterium]|nr:hypothetical protein [Flavobacteriaceae bacterium]
MIAIHNSKTGFHPRWISYCKRKNIPYKLVSCYDNDIINQLKDCDILMWHHNHLNPKDLIFAKQLLFSLDQSGKIVFPNFNDGWHFDDKVGQKYLLEAIDAPLVPSHTFYSKKEAILWANNTSFPKVFKLRGGAGSVNVKLAKTKQDAIHLINKAFGSGFSYYDPKVNFIERWRKYKLGKTNFYDVIKGGLRFFKKPKFSIINGKEIGYIYFQDFIPNNTFDIRVIVIGKKAFALKRMVREGDFKASGSGNMQFAKEEFDERAIEIAFETSRKLKAQCLAYDFVFDENNKPLIVEISFGFAVEAYDTCPGYWDESINWYKGKFNPQEWIVDDLINKI